MTSIHIVADQTRPWLMHPRPLPDEVLTSWLVRTATANEMEVRDFWAAVTGGETLYPRIDSHPSQSILEFLARKARLEVQEVRRLALSRLIEVLTGRDAESVKMPPWLVHFPTARKQIGGQPYCPWCLREDRIPYFRKRWRLAFLTMCDHHQCNLMDYCVHCGHGVELVGYVPGRRKSVEPIPLTKCRRCGQDLTEAADMAATPDDRESPMLIRIGLRLQEEMLRAVRMGVAELPGTGPVPAHQFLETTRKMIVAVNGSKTKDRLEKAIGATIPIGEGMVRPPDEGRHSLQFEHLPVRERRRIMGMAGWLMEDWPARLIYTCQSAKIPLRVVGLG